MITMQWLFNYCCTVKVLLNMQADACFAPPMVRRQGARRGTVASLADLYRQRDAICMSFPAKLLVKAHHIHTTQEEAEGSRLVRDCVGITAPTGPVVRAKLGDGGLAEHGRPDVRAVSFTALLD